MSAFEPIITPTDKTLLINEVFGLAKYKVLEVGSLHTYYVPAASMPNCLREISRLREITYREVGEGTGKSNDTDQFDNYFHHLFLWDAELSHIAGAYRIGLGKEIIEKYGLEGFYLSTLFELDKKFVPLLSHGIELGRSFIIKEYQKKHTVLLALWKSILEILIRHNYHFLIGPVSLDGRYSETIKGLLIEFLKEYYLDVDMAPFVKNKNQTEFTIDPSIDIAEFKKFTNGNFGKLDQYLQAIDPTYSTPVLYRQYANLINGKALGFNVDPLFNNCLDTLMLVDLRNISLEFISNLSKKK